MELTGKQRRFLRAQAVTMKAVVQIGKGGLSNEILTSVRKACDARELVKINILQNSELTTDELADAVEEMGIDVVQTIGRNVVVFKVAQEAKNRKLSKLVQEV